MLLYAIMFPTAYNTYFMSISKIDNVVNFLMHYMCLQFSIANILLSYLYLATKLPWDGVICSSTYILNSLLL